MTRTASLVLLISSMVVGCDHSVVPLAAEGQLYRTGVGGPEDGPEPEEPALEPEHTCAPAWEADDPEQIDGEVPAPVRAGVLQAQVTMLKPPGIDGDVADILLDFETLEPSVLSHLVDGQRVPYVLDLGDRVFERAGSYLAQDEHITEWVIDGTHEGLSLECDMVYEQAQQQFIKTCGKTVVKTLKAELTGAEMPRADLGTSLAPKPSVEFSGSIKAYDIQVTYTYDLYGRQLSDPEFSYKAKTVIENLVELEETGTLKTPVEYELSVTASEVLPGCVYGVFRHTQHLDGASEAEFYLQWQFDF